MGTFVGRLMVHSKPKMLTYPEYIVLIAMTDACDDSSDVVRTNDRKEQNCIGGNVHVSIKKLSDDLGFSRKSLNKAVKGLIEKGFIRLVETRRKTESNTNCYQVNISLLVRLLDFHATIHHYDLDLNDPKVQAFYKSAIAVYEDDFNNTPFTSLTTEAKGLVIDDWEDEVDKNELENLWTTYREKKNSSSEHSTAYKNKAHMKEKHNNALHHDVIEQENSIMIISTTTRNTY